MEKMKYLPSLFKRQPNHTHISDDNFPDQCFTSGEKVKKFRNVDEKRREELQKKKKSMYMADAFKEILSQHQSMLLQYIHS